MAQSWIPIAVKELMEAVSKNQNEIRTLENTLATVRNICDHDYEVRRYAKICSKCLDYKKLDPPDGPVLELV